MAKSILDHDAMNRTIRRMSHEIVENVEDLSNVLIVGIKTRGEFIAKKIVRNIADFEGVTAEFSAVDITHFRDDVQNKSDISVDMSGISHDVNGKTVVLVDDVLFTGRTIRAAMDALVLKGRPKMIKLAVLVDRGHRELPIRADFVGKNIPTSLSETVRVYLNEVDDKEYIEIE